LHTGKLREIDAYELNRLGAFDQPMKFPFAGLVTGPDGIQFRTSSYPHDWPSQRITLHWIRTGLGYRRRPVFVCPHCPRKAVKLYDFGGRLACRVCCNLRYKTQMQDRRAKLKTKARKIRARLLGADSKLGDAWPPRPFNMTRRRYDRYIRKLLQVEGAIRSLDYIASPAYRRERQRNRDGTFITSYDQHRSAI
jgi:hypothetical protein